MANIDVETGGTFDWQQEQIGGGKGYGLFQLDEKKKHYDDYIERRHIPDSARAQIEFMH